MGNSVYKINKGINKSVEFKGLKAQYIWYLGGGIVILLIMFAILYLMGVNQLICLFIIGACGAGLVFKIYQMSHKYGEHGLMKKIARIKIPKAIKNYNRKAFYRKKKEIDG